MSNAVDLKSVFGRAINMESHDERSKFLDEACSGHPGLRAQVEELLASLEEAGEFMEGPAATQLKATADMAQVAHRVGDAVGPYKLLQPIGEGGMGVVFMAEQSKPVERRVALKIIKPGMDSQQVIARFEAERQALAMMDHPNIARVLDAGTTQSNLPYFVMELVKGMPITKYCDEQRLSTQERLRLFLPVCHAVQHAHQKGIIHRDLKPGNVLVARYDDRPIPKVIDFGVAKAITQKLTEKTMFTQFGQVVGTLEYMSPEQAQVNQLDVDTRSDIYSLGVVLYELLTGSTPISGRQLRSAAFDEMMRMIREEDPPLPSIRLSTADTLPSVAANRSIEPRQLGSLIRGDLDWIVMKSLEKDRNRRYDTAKGFANDIQRHLEDEPVLARPPSVSYRLQKAWRRNRVVISAGLTIATSLVIAAAVSIWQAFEATAARHLAEESMQQAVVAKGKASAAQTLAETQRDELRRHAYVGDIGLAHEAIRTGNLGRAQELLARHRPQAGEEDLRGFEWRFLWSRAQGNYTADLGPYDAFLRGLAISPDGKHVAMRRGTGQRIEIVHIDTHSVVKTIEQVAPPLMYSPSGNVLVASREDQLVGFDTRTWRELGTLPAKFPAAFGQSDDGEILVAVNGDQLSFIRATAWESPETLSNASDSKRVLTPGYGNAGHMGTALSVSADGSTVYLAGGTGVRRWDLETLRELVPFATPNGLPEVFQTGNREGFSCSATSPDGTLAVGDRWGQVHLLDGATGEFLYTFDAHTGWVTTVCFSQDGKRLVSAGADRMVIVYDPAQRIVVKRLLGHRQQVWGLDMSANGERVVSAAGHGDHAFVWSLIDAEGSALDRARPTYFAVLADGRILCRPGAGRRSALYDPRTDQFEFPWDEEPVRLDQLREVFMIAASSNAEWLVTQDKQGARTVKVWSLKSGDPPHELLPATGAARALFSPDSRYLLLVGSTGSGGAVGQVNLLRTEDWSGQLLFKGRTAAIGGIAFSGNSNYLAFSDTEHRRVLVYDLHSGPTSILEEQGMNAWSVGLSRTGRWLAVGYTDNRIRIYDFDHQEWVAVLDGHVNSAFSLAFSPDDRTLASSSFAGLKFWNVATWQELLSQEMDAAPIYFSPDGRYLAALATKIGPGVLFDRGYGLRVMRAPALAEIDARIEASEARLRAP